MEPNLYAITGDDFNAIEEFVTDFLKGDTWEAATGFSVDEVMNRIGAPDSAMLRDFRSLLSTLRAGQGQPMVFDIDRFPPLWIMLFIRCCTGIWWPNEDQEPLDFPILLRTQSAHVLNQFRDFPECVFVAASGKIEPLTDIESEDALSISRIGELYSRGEFGRSLKDPS
jgi:hypothetical protein